MRFKRWNHGNDIEDNHAQDGDGKEYVEHASLAYRTLDGGNHRHEDKGGNGTQSHEDGQLVGGGGHIISHIIRTGGIAHGHHGKGRDEEESDDA